NHEGVVVEPSAESELWRERPVFVQEITDRLAQPLGHESFGRVYGRQSAGRVEFALGDEMSPDRHLNRVTADLMQTQRGRPAAVVLLARMDIDGERESVSHRSADPVAPIGVDLRQVDLEIEIVRNGNAGRPEAGEPRFLIAYDATPDFFGITDD